MDLTLDAEQRLLVDTARAALARLCPIAHVRAMEGDPHGFRATLWQELAALGWLGLGLPEEHGGSGRTFLETTLLVEEMGRVLLPSPYLAAVVQAAPLVSALGADAQRGAWLPALAAGRWLATVALVEAGWRDEWQPATFAARGERQGVRLTGTKRFVPFAARVDAILVAAQLDTSTPAIVALAPETPGVTLTRLPTLGGDPLYDVVCDGAIVPHAAVLRSTGAVVEAALERMRRTATVAGLAYMVGAAERVLEMTVEYARTRVQFGRPIGSFQAIAHRCVDMRADLDALRYLVYQGAWSLAVGQPSELEVSAAKVWGNEALRRIFMHAHQVHGAIGFSTEHDLPLFTRRAKAAELTWGHVGLHRDRLARAMGLR